MIMQTALVKDIELRIGESLSIFLYREYVELKRSVKNISEQLNVTHRAIMGWLSRLDIHKRTPQEATNITFDLENAPTELTENEKQVLYGSLMGDGCLTQNKRYSKNYTFQENHKTDQKEYLEWKSEQLQRFRAKVRVLNKKIGQRVGLYTSPAPIFNDLYKVFYGEKKTITKELLNNINELGLAIWYMDDGTYTEKSAKIYTMCFSSEEHLIMQEWFREKWNLDVRICTIKANNKKYNYLRIPVEDTKRFIDIVKSHIHETMKYKIGD